MSKKRAFITGGGTGGHIYPAIAIYDELIRFLPKEDVYYIGNPKNLEKRVTKDHGMTFLPVWVSGMPRHFTFGFVAWVLKVFVSIFASVFYVLRYRPDFIVGTGGYVSFPVLVAGIFLGVPCYIHDSDASPGIVSRALAPYAKCVFLAFDEAQKHLKAKKTIVNGNPLRDFKTGMDRVEACSVLGLSPDKKTLLVMGGSQGAKTINRSILAIAKELTEVYNLQIIHQTGAKNFDEAKKLLPDGLEGYILRPYFDEMRVPYSACDFVVARAGSISLSELNNCALAAILVPYPHAAANHQYHNAKAIEAKGAAIVLEDKDCTPEALREFILTLINDEDKLISMREASQSLAKRDSTQNLVKIVLED